MKLKKILKIIATILISLIVFVGFVAVYPKINPTADSAHTIAALCEKEFYLTAHRGLSSIAPENTKEALVEAGKEGYYAAEFDIEITKDGKWILMHDDTVDRMTNGTGEVSSLTFDEIQSLYIDSGNGIENYANLRITTFEEALAVCEEYGMRAMIEIKGGTADDMAGVLEIIESMNLKNEPMIIDFSSERIEALRKLDNKMELWFIVNKITDESIKFAKEQGAALAFNNKMPVNYAMLGKAKAEGLKLASWTADLLPAADILIAFGVKYVTTNRILP